MCTSNMEAAKIMQVCKSRGGGGRPAEAYRQTWTHTNKLPTGKEENPPRRGRNNPLMKDNPWPLYPQSPMVWPSRTSHLQFVRTLQRIIILVLVHSWTGTVHTGQFRKPSNLGSRVLYIPVRRILKFTFGNSWFCQRKFSLEQCSVQRAGFSFRYE
jgi:hypothetical protein